MDSKLFFSTFALIFFAELPDKTAFATLLMATRAKPAHVFIGVAAAFVVQTLVAVVFGTLFGAALHHWMPLLAGALFLAFGIHSWRKDVKEELEEEKTEVNEKFTASASAWKTIWSSFVVIFIAEWGDLTQIASASLIAKYHAPLTVFVAAVLALWSVTALAIIMGNRASQFLNPRLLDKILGATMSVIGIYFIASFFMSR
jgi:putative Ca2+/H+ antiporter (TMEM165/GDT1 family)